ncbi:hypothetical protein GA0070607_0445 [Micromonospora coriariae]|uniref:Uncharacterized protein n=1 Tax=Micromonospora coriariae TaxID=285665 RepID=A0A1C4UC84_9ACTN|nr:hypothetical protein GA0070607_0445 [Micromonospora coriariae]
MAMNGPPSWAPPSENLQPLRRLDRRVLLRQWLLVAAAVSLIIAVGIVAWRVGRLAAPTLVRWQITLTDVTRDAPPRPDLPASPFAR